MIVFYAFLIALGGECLVALGRWIKDRRDQR